MEPRSTSIGICSAALERPKSRSTRRPPPCLTRLRTVFAAGQISKVSIENGGIVVASYTNGQQATVGQLAVASIANPTSLVQVGDNNLQATAATAQAAIGAAGAGGNGTISGGSLEASNTDMASEFTKLLTYERSYQAASRVITTSDQLTQDTVNLIH
ncbi:MAG: flagellar hook-basal body complex protein [Ignavibacteriota bacterium]